VIPIRDANPTQRVPVVTLALIAANIAVFLLWQPSFGTEQEQQAFYFCHAEIPWEVSHQENLAHGGLEARAAIDAGYEHALPSILDTHITTFLSGLILFQFGSGPIKGFAVTLCIGLVSSLFTAFVGTRLVWDYVLSRGRLQTVSI
jgi:membrane associated rhomboid family serine protease